MAGDGAILIRWYDSVMKNPPFAEETMDMDDEDMTWESTPKTDMLQLALDSLREVEHLAEERPEGWDRFEVARLRMQFAQAIELRRIANALEGQKS